MRRLAAMAAWVGVLAALQAAGPASPAHAAAACGDDRPAVRAGTDADAGSVALGSSVLTTVAALSSAARPVAPLPGLRVAPTERTRFEVGARLLAYRVLATGAVQLELGDAQGRKLTAVLPDPACVPATSPFHAAAAAARAAFDAVYPATTAPRPTDAVVRVSGVGHFAGGGTPTAAVSVALEPVLSFAVTPAPSVDRLAGADRYETAAATSRAAFPAGATEVFVASGATFADALSGSAAAATRHAPVLLVGRDVVPAATRAELQRLGPHTLYLLGGRAAVSGSVATALAAFADQVVRISGADRYGTSAAVARRFYSPGVSDLLVATGQAFPDALAGSATAGALGVPVLLTTSARLPAVVSVELARLQPARITLVGGTAAVSSGVQRALTAAAPVRRVAGSDRYDTAARVGAVGFPGSRGALLATGSDFADALAGGPAAVRRGVPVLLARPGCLPTVTGAALSGSGRVTVLGGTRALSTAVAGLTPCAQYVVPPFVGQVPLPSGCLEVGPPIVGVKVYLVQRALGLTAHKERYDSATLAAVRAFQSTHGLPVTGRVGPATWAALQTGYDFCVDRFTVQPTVAPAAPAAEHVAAALAWAHARVGTRYVWGGAGPVGYDCSGLALQAMYAGGRLVPGLTTDQHVQATFNTAAAIYANRALQHVPLAQRRPGDLLFWGGDFHHMALYLGHDQVVEAVRPAVRTGSMWADGTPLATVVRPFPG